MKNGSKIMADLVICYIIAQFDWKSYNWWLTNSKKFNFKFWLSSYENQMVVKFENLYTR